MREVCVIIPVYNGKGIVDKCIKALTMQTYQPDQIVCVDDKSSDGSASYIREKFPFVKVIENKVNMGAAAAYARGMKYACERDFKWVWLLDQDDVPFMDALENLLKFSMMWNRVILTSTLIEPSSRFIYLMLTRRPVRLDQCDLYEAELVNFAGMLIPTNAIKEVGYPLRSLTMAAADWEYCLRLRKAGYRIYVSTKSRVYHIEGHPKVVYTPIPVTLYRLEKGEIRRKIRSRYGLIRLDPSSRHYTRGKNIVIVFISPLATNFIKLFCMQQLIKHLIKILLYEEKRLPKIFAFIHGVFDGFGMFLARRTLMDACTRSFEEQM